MFSLMSMVFLKSKEKLKLSMIKQMSLAEKFKAIQKMEAGVRPTRLAESFGVQEKQSQHGSIEGQIRCP